MSKTKGQEPEVTKTSKPSGARKAGDLVGGFPAKISATAAAFDPTGAALYVLRPSEEDRWSCHLVRIEVGKPEVAVATVPTSTLLLAQERVVVPCLPRGVCVVDVDGEVRRIDVEEDSSLSAFAYHAGLVAMLVDVGPGEPVGRRLHEVRMYRVDGSLVWSTKSNDILFGSNGIAFSEDSSSVYTNQHDVTADVATVMRWDAATGQLRGVERVPAGAGEILFVAPNGYVVTRPFSTVVHVHRSNFCDEPNATPLLVAKAGSGGFAGFDTIKDAAVTDRELFVLCGKGERTLLFRRPLGGGEGELMKCPLLPSRLAVGRGVVAIVGFSQRAREVRLFPLDG